MFEDDASHESFAETLRSIVLEVSRSIERAAQVDLDESRTPSASISIA